MAGAKLRVTGAAAGAAAGLLGLASLARCPGGNCSSCFGCLGTGAALLFAVLARKASFRRRKGLDLPGSGAAGGK